MKCILVFFAIIFADRLTKWYALGLVQEKIVNPFLSFALVFNRGINWGFLNTGSSATFIIINITIAAVIVGMSIYTWYAWRHHQNIAGNICILAGALSNYFDRIYYGGVIDFIVLSYGSWSWPAFNVADSAICLGVGLLLMMNYRTHPE